MESIKYWQKKLNFNQYKIINERKMTRQELDNFYKSLNNRKVKFEYTKKRWLFTSSTWYIESKINAK